MSPTQPAMRLKSFLAPYQKGLIQLASFSVLQYSGLNYETENNCVNTSVGTNKTKECFHRGTNQTEMLDIRNLVTSETINGDSEKVFTVMAHLGRRHVAIGGLDRLFRRRRYGCCTGRTAAFRPRSCSIHTALNRLKG